MKNLLLIVTCVVLLGCNNRPVAEKPIHWALVNKHEIDMAIFKWSQARVQEASKAEDVSPEMEQQLRRYDSLRMQLTLKEARRGIPLRQPRGTATAPEPKDEEYETLAKQVEQAKAPIAGVLARRDQLMAKYHDVYTTEKLVSEYAKGRFELVVDSGWGGSKTSVLFSAGGEVLDITAGVLESFDTKVAGAN
ncbi:MAG: hypothetical protein ACXWBP_10335 [Limisphaerales bacterium]